MTDSDLPLAYVPDKPRNTPTPDELRARIPGWGADLDPGDRPAVPRIRFDPAASGAHWEFPERQQGGERRERSIEHAFLTPAFGTAQPLHGVSGLVRRLAYRYSEGRAAHWLLLIAGDRVDSAGSHLRSFLTAKPDELITETGVLAEAGNHPIASRTGSTRSDVHHTWIDPLIVAGPWVLGGLAAWTILRRTARLIRR